MRRISLLLISAVVLVGTVLIGSGTVATAQETDLSDHLLVGTWIIEYQDDPVYREMATIFSDGTSIVSAPDGSNGQGVWESTGETSAIMTMSVVFEDGTRLLARVSIEIAPDGESYMAVITTEFFDSSDEGSGEIGPGMAHGTRIQVQAPGTPIASFEEYFGASEATPEATPAS